MPISGSDAKLIHGWLLVAALSNGEPPASFDRTASYAGGGSGGSDECDSCDDDGAGGSNDEDDDFYDGATLVDEQSASRAASAVSVGTPSHGGVGALLTVISSPAPAPRAAAPWEQLAPHRLAAAISVLRRLGVVPYAPAAVAVAAQRATEAHGSVVSPDCAPELRSDSDTSHYSGTDGNKNSARVSSGGRTLAQSCSPLVALELAVPLGPPALRVLGTASGVSSRISRVAIALLPARVAHWFDAIARYAAAPAVAKVLSQAQRHLLAETLSAPPWARRAIGCALLHEILRIRGAEARCAVVAVTSAELGAGVAKEAVVAGFESLRRHSLLSANTSREALLQTLAYVEGSGGGNVTVLIHVSALRALLSRKLVRLARNAATLVLAPRAGRPSLRSSLRFTILCLAGGAASARDDAPSAGPFSLFSGAAQWLTWRDAGDWLDSVRKSIKRGSVWELATVPSAESSASGTNRRRRRGGKGGGGDEDSDDGDDGALHDALAKPAGRAAIERAARLRGLIALVIAPRKVIASAAAASTNQPYLDWSAEARATISASAAADAPYAPREWVGGGSAEKSAHAARWAPAAFAKAEARAAFTPSMAALAPGGWRVDSGCGSGKPAEWEYARTSVVAPLAEGLLDVAKALLWHATWLATARCGGVRPTRLMGCAGLRVADLCAGGTPPSPRTLTEPGHAAVEALRILFFLARLESCDGARRERLWAWHRILRAAVAVGAYTLAADLAQLARGDTFLAALPPENTPWPSRSQVAKARRSSSSSSSESSVDVEHAAAMRSAPAAKVPLFALRAMKWPGPVRAIGLDVRHAAAPPAAPGDARGDAIPQRRSNSAAVSDAAATSTATTSAAAAAAASVAAPLAASTDAAKQPPPPPPHLPNGRARAWHVGADGLPATVERIVCEALVSCAVLRNAALSPINLSRTALHGDGRGGVGGGDGSKYPAPLVEWPPGLARGVAGMAARAAVAPGAPGLAAGDPFSLAATFPALATPGVAWCARPGTVLRPGAVLVKDAGGGAAAAAAVSPCGAWRAAHTENAVWSSLYAALLYESFAQERSPALDRAWLGLGSPTSMALERAWKHPWQTAPLDADGADGGAAHKNDARRVVVAARIDAIARMGRCELGAAALAGARAITGVSFLRMRGDAAPPEELAAIAHAAGGRFIAFVLRRLANDPSAHASGLPDVAVWRVSTSCCDLGGGGGAGAGAPPPPDDEPCFALVEVKSDGDRVQPTQLEWFAAWETWDDELSPPVTILRVVSS